MNRDEQRPGRPEIGEPINVRLGDDLLTKVDAFAAAANIKRAEALRRLVSKATDTTRRKETTMTSRVIERKGWHVDEVILMTDYMVDRDGAMPRGVELTALRDELFPYRTELSVHGKAWDIRGALGHQPGGEPSKLNSTVAALFKGNPDDMAELAYIIKRQRH